MDLSIIIVNWNSAELLLKCLNSVNQFLEDVKYEIFVVDNCSDQAEILYLKEELEPKFPGVTFFYNTNNLGFAKANNLAFRHCTGEYVLLLNPDTCLIERGLNELFALLDDQKIGMVGCKLLNGDGTSQLSIFHFPYLHRILATSFLLHRILPVRFRSHLTYSNKSLENPQRPDWILGAFMLLKRDVMNRIKGLDEGIFMYGEDMDLCYRVRGLELDIIYTPDYSITHYGGCSGSKAWSDAKREVLIYRAIFYFYRKYLPAWQLPVARGIYALGAVVRLIGNAISCLVPGRSQHGVNEMRTQWAVLLFQLFPGSNTKSVEKGL